MLVKKQKTKMQDLTGKMNCLKLYLGLLCTFVLASVVYAEPVKALKLSKPNIILIMPDDAGYGDYACLGNPYIKTPQIDSFKEQSLLFTQFHVSPKCGPTRAALMSGAHEFRSGVTHTILERERMNLKMVTAAPAV